MHKINRKQLIQQYLIVIFIARIMIIVVIDIE